MKHISFSWKLLVGGIMLSISTSVLAASFTDVPESFPNYTAIESLKLHGIIGGYSDGSFKPGATVNRSEAIKMVLLGAGISVNTSVNESSPLPFSDVKKTDWFLPYLEEAKKRGIVKGNGNIFSPARPVNLAEMLKITFLASGISVSDKVTVKPFKDIPVTEWHASYFAFAKENKIIPLPQSDIIRPAHEVTRAELAEIIYKVRLYTDAQVKQQIYASMYLDSEEGNATASGEKYNKILLTAAQKNGSIGSIIEVTNLLNNKAVVLRVNDTLTDAPDSVPLKLSAAAFQTISPLTKSNIPVRVKVLSDKAPLVDQMPKSASCKTTFGNAETYPVNIFKNAEQNIDITLDVPLKKHYASQEIINLSGKITTKETEITALIKDESGSQTLFVAPITLGAFSVDVSAGGAGGKQITLIPGSNGTNFVAPITVYALSCFPDAQSKTKESPIPTFTLENNKVKFSWNSVLPLSRIVFKQGDRELTRYFAGGKHTWNVAFSDFALFSPGQISVRIDTADSSNKNFSGQNSFWNIGNALLVTAIDHQFSIINTSGLEMKNFPSTYGFGGDISFSGKTLQNIRPELAIITPLGTVETLNLITKAGVKTNAQQVEYIPAGSEFSVSYHPKERGTYILEMNHESGIAVLNAPVYESSSLPLIPDFMDTRNSLNEELTISKESFSAELLNRINIERKSALQGTLQLDDKLSILAQFRADDMIKNGYIAHWDKDGKDVNDIRLSYGVVTAVGENIAKDDNLLFAHLGLMRSALHRKNIIDEHWDTAGFGFAKTKDGSLLVVELFSSKPISSADTPALRDEMLSLINAKRNSPMVLSATLTAIAQTWTDSMASTNFFDFTDNSGNTLTNLIRKSGVNQTVGTFIVGNNSLTDLKAMLENHKEVQDAKWTKVGIGIAQDKDGIIKMTVLYSE